MDGINMYKDGITVYLADAATKSLREDIGRLQLTVLHLAETIDGIDRQALKRDNSAWARDNLQMDLILEMATSLHERIERMEKERRPSWRDRIRRWVAGR